MENLYYLFIRHPLLVGLKKIINYYLKGYYFPKIMFLNFFEMFSLFFKVCSHLDKSESCMLICSKLCMSSLETFLTVVDIFKKLAFSKTVLQKCALATRTVYDHAFGRVTEEITWWSHLGLR